MISRIRNNKGFLLVLEIILVLVIIYFLVNKTLNVYFKRPSMDGKIINSFMGKEAGVSGYKDIAGYTVREIDNITKQRLNEIENIEKQLGQ